MISKSLFFNWMKEDRKRRTWTVVLFSFLCFLYTAAYELFLENMGDRLQNSLMTKAEYMDQIMVLTGRSMIPFYLILCGIGAVLFGFQGFSWLMKKQQIDFYHSLPVTRTQRFFVGYFNGIILFTVPFGIHLVISNVLLFVRGVLTKEVVFQELIFYALYFLTFFILYHLILVAVMMSGNLLVAFLGAGVFLLYAFALRLIGESYCGEFFETYYALERNPFTFLSYFSPLERIIRSFEIVLIGEQAYGDMGKALGWMFGMIVLTLFLSWKLYQMRKSERAGKALMFPKSAAVIRISIMILAAMISGMFFGSVTGSFSTVWMYLGSIIGAVFFHGLLEVIFHGDIKAMFGKKIQLILGIACCLLIVSIFRFDLFGYDSYLPKEEQIKSIAYYMNLTSESGYYGLLAEKQMDSYCNYDVKDGKIMLSEYGGDKYQMERSRTEDITVLYSIISAWQKEHKNEGEETKQFQVCFELKNGKKVYRRYDMSRSFLKEYFAPVFESEKGKEVFYPAVQLTKNGVKKIVCASEFMEKNLELKEEQIEELLACYQKDIRKKTFDDYLEENNLGTVTIYYELSQKKELRVELDVTNKSSFMLDYLKSVGCDMELPGTDYTLQSVVLCRYEDSTFGGENNTFWKGKTEQKLSKEEEKVILPFLVPPDYMTYENLPQKHYVIDAQITLVHKTTGAVKVVNYTLAQEDAPTFLKEN